MVLNSMYKVLCFIWCSGERRIRVHTMALPTASNLTDVLHSADQQCIIGLLSKMGKWVYICLCCSTSFWHMTAVAKYVMNSMNDCVLFHVDYLSTNTYSKFFKWCVTHCLKCFTNLRYVFKVHSYPNITRLRLAQNITQGSLLRAYIE